MQFFGRFKWAMPTSFADALSYCRFEEGDVLYNAQAIYELPWSEGRKLASEFIQIAFPPSLAGSAAGQVFSNNWSSEVRFDRVTENSKRVRVITTQGRLYTALWRGRMEITNPGSPEPLQPLWPKNVPRSTVTAARIGACDIQTPAFLMVVDSASQLARTKIAELKCVLERHTEGGPRVIEPHAIGLENWFVFAPTVEFVVFETPRLSSGQLHNLIKAAVYRPQRDSKKDMFRIAAHGWLIEE